jgi:hypothetical protein
MMREHHSRKNKMKKALFAAALLTTALTAHARNWYSYNLNDPYESDCASVSAGLNPLTDMQGRYGAENIRMEGGGQLPSGTRIFSISHGREIHTYVSSLKDCRVLRETVLNKLLEHLSDFATPETP